MKVLTVYDDPTVLDLVAHFLGIATHHNDNAAPSAIAVPFGVSGIFEPRRVGASSHSELAADPFRLSVG